jgi:hypothetical protein
MTVKHGLAHGAQAAGAEQQAILIYRFLFKVFKLELFLFLK